MVISASHGRFESSAKLNRGPPAGQPYHWKVAVDVNGDDLVACSGPGGINSACTTALADDDPEGTRPNNIKTRDLPIVRIVQ